LGPFVICRVSTVGLYRTDWQRCKLEKPKTGVAHPAIAQSWLGLDPTVVIGHVRPVHRAQRDTHGRCNRRLRHPALAQQYHLDALTLHGGNFPAQRRLQLPDLGIAAFDHLFPLRIRWSERITPCSSVASNCPSDAYDPCSPGTHPRPGLLDSMQTFAG